MPLRSFGSVFIAVVVATALLMAAFMIQRARPRGETQQPAAQFVLATGKCAECHRRTTPGIVHEYEMSRHAARNISCLDCHQPLPGQEKLDHRGFVIAKTLTAANCQTCHKLEYDQYLRSRHAAPAWAAIAGPDDFTPQQIAQGEQFHPGWVKREANPLVKIEGTAAVNKGCYQCHAVGRPNADGSIGTCTACHARHVASVELARNPRTCGQCHMGPDHSQIEIYEESKHGALFAAQRAQINLGAEPSKTTTADTPVPTCATCHMGALDHIASTHDTTERLSYYLFAAVSERRPNALLGQKHMQEVCLQCHTSPRIEKFYTDAEQVISCTNDIVRQSQAIMQQLYDEHLLKPGAFDQPIQYLAFDLWHYYGRTAKHGAFMGGADFVQWHGYYELVNKRTELRYMADELRKNAPHPPTTQGR